MFVLDDERDEAEGVGKDSDGEGDCGDLGDDDIFIIAIIIDNIALLVHVDVDVDVYVDDRNDQSVDVRRRNHKSKPIVY